LEVDIAVRSAIYANFIYCPEVGSLALIAGLLAVQCHEVGSLGALIAGLLAVLCHEVGILALAVLLGPGRAAIRVLC